ncbi:hypothetical protein EIP91_003124 [Steccherinum ochraceum]|uniref:Uncharacterized protein n=1 Tax=Steccherinum ochraceum TaxID=92696 RepID=A0A4R0RSE2_9APHY|nr:hypothetical protein EIP91_003124 [Steccherinum ochraceum]
MSSEGLSTQRTFVKYLVKNLPSRLLHLKLSYLPRIDSVLLSTISAKLCKLKTLELNCTERLVDDCCWDCCEDASTCTIHSPIPDVYADVEDLSLAYATALTPLTQLEHLHLGIYLSELDIFYYHLYNCRTVTFQTILGPAVMGTSVLGGPDACDACRSLFAADVRATELYATGDVEDDGLGLETGGEDQG